MRKFVVLALILGITLIAFAALAATSGHTAQATTSHNATVSSHDPTPTHTHQHDANVTHTNHTTHHDGHVAERPEHWGHRFLHWLHRLIGTGHSHTRSHPHPATKSHAIQATTAPCTDPGTGFTSHETGLHDAAPNPSTPIPHPPRR